jgi:hypothetical protein
MYLSYLILFCLLMFCHIPKYSVPILVMRLIQVRSLAHMCACVYVWRSWGQAVHHKHPTGQERYVFTETWECVGKHTRNPIVYSRSYRRVWCGIAVWVMPVENLKEYNFSTAFRIGLKRSCNWNLLTLWPDGLVWFGAVSGLKFVAICKNQPTKCAQPFSLFQYNYESMCKRMFAFCWFVVVDYWLYCKVYIFAVH